MAWISAQIAVSSTPGSPTPVFAPGTFPNFQGDASVPFPALIQALGGTVYFGGPSVSTANGYPLAANGTIPVGLLGNDIVTLQCIAGAGGVTLALLVGRQ